MGQRSMGKKNISDGSTPKNNNHIIDDDFGYSNEYDSIDNYKNSLIKNSVNFELNFNKNINIDLQKIYIKNQYIKMKD